MKDIVNRTLLCRLHEKDYKSFFCFYVRLGISRPPFQLNNEMNDDANSYPFHEERSQPNLRKPFSTQATPPRNNNGAMQFLAFDVLLPTVMVLIAICFILGIVLIIKSYMMTPLKQNLAVAIRRRRRFGHAPDNQYIPPAEMHAPRPSFSERKSLPPPEVLAAARARASQLMHV